METLIKVDPGKHMYRWYSVGIQGTLVDGITVIYGWGSLKSAFQQWRTVPAISKIEAERLVNKMLEKRLRKGYVRKHEPTASN